jgi:hypothetical protein
MRIVWTACIWVVLAVMGAWAGAALYFDFPVAWMRVPVVVLFGAALLRAAFFVKQPWQARTTWVLGFLLALAWWSTLEPSNTRQWMPDVAETAWSETAGDRLTVHNVRNCEYRTETDYTPRWETRTYDLSQLRAADIFITYWGSPWIAHPIVSFQFGDKDHLAFSIETRKEVGEEYSAVKGFFRQFELTYIAADERDVIRLRTNFRKGEEVYLYRMRLSKERLRASLEAYLEHGNRLHERAEWYNALTKNCTTSVRRDAADMGVRLRPWDWRILANGRGDELMYERGQLEGGLPFADLKERAHINAAAQAANDAPDFSERIRAGRPGF